MQPSPYSDADFAASYDRLALPHHFAAPARDLVNVLEVPPGASVLDVGSGTGAVATAAREAVGPTGRVTAVEPSLALLSVLKPKRVCEAVAGAAPGLPFRAACFDRVLASFVLSHLGEADLALADMMRVLRPKGRLGVTAWGPGQVEAMRLWKEVVADFASLDRLQESARSIIPWDERFSQRVNLVQALQDAGLTGVVVHVREYQMKFRVEDWLRVRETSVEGLLLRRQLDPQRWPVLQQAMRARFEARFTNTIEYAREVLLGCGSRAAW
jgi:ubiquinone/menaquinone biosynthesis C-methylase UbiE